MKSLQDSLRLFATYEHSCPYLPNKHSVNAIVDPKYPMEVTLYSKMINEGYRRSGKQVYRPYCPDCNECISTRIPVNEFKRSRSQKRNWRLNQDLDVTENNDSFSSEYGDLYTQYLSTRHPDGEMEPEAVDDFSAFVKTNWCNTSFYEFRKDNKLLCVAAVDQLEQGLSAVYTFFNPEVSRKRGLGTYALLWEIEQAKQKNLDYVYPGYWIKDSDKMRYKTHFRPIYGRVNAKWIRLN